MVDDGVRTRPFLPDHPVFRVRVTSIAAGPHGIVAVATRGNGVLLVRGTQYLQLDQQKGLPSNLCGNLSWGRRGLWVASHQGQGADVVQEDLVDKLGEVLSKVLGDVHSVLGDELNEAFDGSSELVIGHLSTSQGYEVTGG